MQAPTPSRLRLFVAVWLLLVAADSQAYIDPNAGGLLYQILLPLMVVLAAGWHYVRLAAKAAWRWLSGGWRKPPAEDDRA